MRNGSIKNEDYRHRAAKHLHGRQKWRNGGGRSAGRYCTSVKLLEDSRRRNHIASAAPSLTKRSAFSPPEEEQTIDKRGRAENSVNMPTRTQQKESCEIITKRTKQRRNKENTKQQQTKLDSEASGSILAKLKSITTVSSALKKKRNLTPSPLRIHDDHIL